MTVSFVLFTLSEGSFLTFVFYLNIDVTYHTFRIHLRKKYHFTTPSCLFLNFLKAVSVFLMKQDNVSWNYLFHVFKIIQPTYDYEFTIQWYQNNLSMFWHPLSEKCLSSGLLRSVFLDLLGEYGDLVCKFPYSVQIQEKVWTRKKTPNLDTCYIVVKFYCS